MQLNREGFSIVEAMVAAVILSVSVVGVFATLSSQKAPAAQADQRVLAAQAAKQFLEELRSKVNASDYINDTGLLATGGHDMYAICPGATCYDIHYTVTLDGNARKVDLNITW